MNRPHYERRTDILRYIVCISFIALFFPVPDGRSQTNDPSETPGEEAIDQAPKTIEQPAYEYYYWPEEDLNNFGLSTIGEGKSGSTLGDKSKRTSNIEANEYLRSAKENRENTGEQEKEESQNEQAEPLIVEPVERSISGAPSDRPMYEWKDKDGNLHITNDLGKVPQEYQDQVYEARDTGQ